MSGPTITADIVWVKRGISKSIPEKVKLTADEIRHLIQCESNFGSFVLRITQVFYLSSIKCTIKANLILNVNSFFVLLKLISKVSFLSLRDF